MVSLTESAFGTLPPIRNLAFDSTPIVQRLTPLEIPRLKRTTSFPNLRGQSRADQSGINLLPFVDVGGLRPVIDTRLLYPTGLKLPELNLDPAIVDSPEDSIPQEYVFNEPGSISLFGKLSMDIDYRDWSQQYYPAEVRPAELSQAEDLPLMFSNQQAYNEDLEPLTSRGVPSLAYTSSLKSRSSTVSSRTSGFPYYSRTPSQRTSWLSHDSGLEDCNGIEEVQIKGRCPNPDCHKVFKDLKAHMLTHLNERPEKCPITTCEYHIKGFARKYDKNRHTLTHYKGTMVCGFCPGSGSSAEKTFNRADVFKRHLTSVHGVEQTPPNSRRRALQASAIKVLGGYPSGATGRCSTCSGIFDTAQVLYEHLDDCVLNAVLRQDPTEDTVAQCFSKEVKNLSSNENGDNPSGAKEEKSPEFRQWSMVGVAEKTYELRRAKPHRKSIKELPSNIIDDARSPRLASRFMFADDQDLDATNPSGKSFAAIPSFKSTQKHLEVLQQSADSKLPQWPTEDEGSSLYPNEPPKLSSSESPTTSSLIDPYLRKWPIDGIMKNATSSGEVRSPCLDSVECAPAVRRPPSHDKTTKTVVEYQNKESFEISGRQWINFQKEYVFFSQCDSRN